MKKEITKQQKWRNSLDRKGIKSITIAIKKDHDGFFKFLAEASRDGKL